MFLNTVTYFTSAFPGPQLLTYFKKRKIHTHTHTYTIHERCFRVHLV